MIEMTSGNFAEFSCMKRRLQDSGRGFQKNVDDPKNQVKMIFLLGSPYVQKEKHDFVTHPFPQKKKKKLDCVNPALQIWAIL